ATGLTTDKRSFDVDVIVFATGFDAMTGAIKAVHPITGRDGKSLSDVWANGPQTYLGLTVSGFPNLFLITGPVSPSVLSIVAASDPTAASATKSSAAGCWASGCQALMLPSSATMVRWFGCSRTCGWCWACWRR